MRDLEIIRTIINPDETFIWETTGSAKDVKFNPLYLLLAILTLGIHTLCLHYKRVFHHYILTNQRLIIISGIFGKRFEIVELFRVLDCFAEQSLIDTWAGLGTICINSTDKPKQVIMKKIPNPYYIIDSLRDTYMTARKEKGVVMLESSR